MSGHVAAGLSVKVGAESETTEQHDGRDNSSCCHSVMSSVERHRLYTSWRCDTSNWLAGSLLIALPGTYSVALCLRAVLQPLMFLLAPLAPAVAFLSHLLVLVGKFLQFLIREMFDVNHLILRLINGLDDFIEFQVNGAGVPVLRVLNQKHYEKSDDGRSRIYDELPRVGVVEVGPGYKP